MLLHTHMPPMSFRWCSCVSPHLWCLPLTYSICSLTLECHPYDQSTSRKPHTHTETGTPESSKNTKITKSKPKRPVCMRRPTESMGHPTERHKQSNKKCVEYTQQKPNSFSLLIGNSRVFAHIIYIHQHRVTTTTYIRVPIVYHHQYRQTHTQTQTNIFIAALCTPIKWPPSKPFERARVQAILAQTSYRQFCFTSAGCQHST